jgi:hypothetical protein
MPLIERFLALQTCWLEADQLRTTLEFSILFFLLPQLCPTLEFSGEHVQ